MANIKLRPVELTDIPLLLRWDEQPHVIACDPNGEWDWHEVISCDYDWQEMLVAELRGRPIGFLQIIDPAKEVTHYWGEVEDGLRAIDIWIGAADDLSRGYGTEMMQLAFDRCFKSDQVHGIMVDPLASNLIAHRFYERLGFQFVESRIFGGELCFVYRLDRKDWHAGSNPT